MMRPVNVQYRKFEHDHSEINNKGLFKIVENALDEIVDDKKRRSSAQLRMVEFYERGTAVLNLYEPLENWAFGELALFNPGQGVPVIVASETGNELDLRELSLKADQHLIKGVLYWLFCGEHVVFIQPPNVSQNLLKDYLNWLVCDNGPKISGPLKLEAQVSVDDAAKPQVKEIGIRTSSDLQHEETVNEVVSETEVTRLAGTASLAETSQALDIARAAGLTEPTIRYMAESAEGGELVADVKFHLKKKGKRVRLEKAKVSALLNDNENDEISLWGESGKFVGNLTRLTHPNVRVATVGEFLDPVDCKRALVEAYNYFRSNAHIDGEDLRS